MTLSSQIIAFEKILATGKDNALLRFSLGNEYYKIGDTTKTIEHLQQAVRHDPAYSAAWKLLGRVLTETQHYSEALDAYRSGIAAAEKKGDKQAMKEMQVFMRRIEKVVSAKP